MPGMHQTGWYKWPSKSSELAFEMDGRPCQWILWAGKMKHEIGGIFKSCHLKTLLFWDLDTSIKCLKYELLRPKMFRNCFICLVLVYSLLFLPLLLKFKRKISLYLMWSGLNILLSLEVRLHYIIIPRFLSTLMAYYSLW